ncbi:hypothetical protein PR048_008336 [Dryococelus australis]|uniref:Uncharacterized protein n=1 Tax=Dryococelus australis TaxID=614101 RepID=A0ABQ9HWT5_9NEOP|nr:hypothetical protein PR048_008336 [Dryococelus australis]
MDAKTFDCLLEKVRSYIQKQNTRMRECTSPKHFCIFQTKIKVSMEKVELITLTCLLHNFLRTRIIEENNVLTLKQPEEINEHSRWSSLRSHQGVTHSSSESIIIRNEFMN